MTQIAIVTYPGFTALDFIGPYEVLRWLPDTEVRFVWHEPGPIIADSGVLKTLGAIPVGDERVVHEGNIITSAGVSAGIDLALWLAGQIGGDERAKAIQLSMEYDPQPPFDSGHMSKASAKTKAAATALMAGDVAKPAQLKAGTLLLWDRALSVARAKAASR